MSRETPIDALGIDRWPVEPRYTPDLPIGLHVPESIHHIAKRLNPETRRNLAQRKGNRGR